MKKRNVKKGFSLIELIIATAIMVIVVLSATTLLVSIIRSNAENVHRLTAYGLCQEGLEAVRNIRDSDWLLGANFEGKVGKYGTVQPWGADFPSATGESRNYTVEFRDPDLISVTTSAGLLNVAPWVLNELGAETDLGSSDKTQLYKVFHQVPVPETRYSYSRSDNKSLFHRYVTVKREDAKKYRVTSIVNWQEGGILKEVRLDTELTAWKENQL
jgi:prepilin-type N-terminal cleavage/methylation domain-containing protein